MNAHTPQPQDTGSKSVDYFDYLRCRSVIARLYRNPWLYPRLCSNLFGTVSGVGCGIGDFLSFRPRTIGTDINPRATHWCWATGHKVAPIQQPDVLPFSDDSFDGVVIDNVFEHIAEPMPLLAEVCRVMRPRAKVLVGVPGRRGYDSDPVHKVFYDQDSLILVMGWAGFAARKILPMPFKSSWLDAHMRQYRLYAMFQK